jgi:hypothetical protein
MSLSLEVRVWINGHELTAIDKPKRDGRREYSLSPRAEANGSASGAATPLLRSSRNVLAVQVAPTAKSTEVLLKVRLDEVRRPPVLAAEESNPAAEVTQKLVTERAVVCDLCSVAGFRIPACIRACPHDAAMRLDARLELPKL